MGKFESDGTVVNGQNLLIGKIDSDSSKIYDAIFSEVAFFNNNQVLDFENTIQGSIQNQNIYNGENILIGSFSSIVALRAIFLLMYYY
jgi:hypothetical protein